MSDFDPEKVERLSVDAYYSEVIVKAHPGGEYVLASDYEKLLALYLPHKADDDAEDWERENLPQLP